MVPAAASLIHVESSSGYRVENVSYDEICHSDVPGLTFVPTRSTASEAATFCRMIGGRLHAVTDRKEQDKMLEAFRTKGQEQCVSPRYVTNDSFTFFVNIRLDQ